MVAEGVMSLLTVQLCRSTAMMVTLSTETLILDAEQLDNGMELCLHVQVENLPLAKYMSYIVHSTFNFM